MKKDRLQDEPSKFPDLSKDDGAVKRLTENLRQYKGDKKERRANDLHNASMLPPIVDVPRGKNKIDTSNKKGKTKQ